ncbi:FRG domain-containing protein [Lacihabitans sp. CCS-44]|uniref:FRG domain-containing protein n=1 Tax=Lacihabitans sp. CCS-44 TaxID=2487331 RepID=UPI0020CB957F|nr:FRG domain-containing protein [Lacihabitans sp. CCS-44]MCP9756451.1 FRG domain-containing protein [Lacihabitans sp. CCS-44]
MMIVKSLDEFMTKCKNIKTISFASKYYRGQTDSTWDVQSSLSRFIIDNRIETNPIEVQKELLRMFDKKVVENNLVLKSFNNVVTSHYESSWHTLSQAQHIGIPTSLIDFTFDETFALRFALGRTEIEKDAAVYIYSLENGIEPICSSNCNLIDPYSTDRSYLVNINYKWDIIEYSGEKNRWIQKGLFLLQNYMRLATPINKGSHILHRFNKIIIPIEYKEKIRKELEIKHFPRTGFNNAEMYTQCEQLAKIVEEIRKNFLRSSY